MTNDRLKLDRLEIKGFKSISSEGQNIDLGDITVLLGANGSGKSNLVSFFKMLCSLKNHSRKPYRAAAEINTTFRERKKELTIVT